MRENRLRLTVACLTMLTVMTGQAQAGIIYSNDFETNSNGFVDYDWFIDLPTSSDGDLDSPGSGPSSTFLGGFTNEHVILSLTGLIPGEIYDVQLDLFVGGSWDGNGTPSGPDVWTMRTGIWYFVQTTFSNNPSPDDPAPPQSRQDYSDTHPFGVSESGDFDAQTGADVVNDDYAIYYFGHGAGNPLLSFEPNQETATIRFYGSGLDDEFWAIDNVAVSLRESSPTNPAPEPSSLALLAIGGIGMAIGTVRRRRQEKQQ